MKAYFCITSSYSRKFCYSGRLYWKTLSPLVFELELAMSVSIDHLPINRILQGFARPHSLGIDLYNLPRDLSLASVPFKKPHPMAMSLLEKNCIPMNFVAQYHNQRCEVARPTITGLKDNFRMTGSDIYSQFFGGCLESHTPQTTTVLTPIQGWTVMMTAQQYCRSHFAIVTVTLTFAPALACTSPAATF